MVLYGVILFRTILLYGLILLIFRLMGKREIGELSLLDLVVFLMIAEMAVISIEQPEEPLGYTVVPMVFLMFIQLGSALLSLKSQKFREIVDGTPTIIIEEGKIDEKAMKKLRYNFQDLMIQLRDKDVFFIEEVQYAILEPSGKLSVLKKTEEIDAAILLPKCLVLDGEIQWKELNNMNKNEKWLMRELRLKGFHTIDRISYCHFHNNKWWIDEKSNDAN